MTLESGNDLLDLKGSESLEWHGPPVLNGLLVEIQGIATTSKDMGLARPKSFPIGLKRSFQNKRLVVHLGVEIRLRRILLFFFGTCLLLCIQLQVDRLALALSSIRLR